MCDGEEEEEEEEDDEDEERPDELLEEERLEDELLDEELRLLLLPEYDCPPPGRAPAGGEKNAPRADAPQTVPRNPRRVSMRRARRPARSRRPHVAATRARAAPRTHGGRPRTR